MTSWQLSEFLQARRERGRQLLQESEKHQEDVARKDAIVERTRQFQSVAQAHPASRDSLPVIRAVQASTLRGTPMPACSHCGKHKDELRMCASCRSARYCSRECQVAAWKHGHKQECGRLAAERANS